MENLSQEESNVFEQFMELTSKIADIYAILIRLGMNGKKSSNEYKTEVNKLDGLLMLQLVLCDSHSYMTYYNIEKHINNLIKDEFPTNMESIVTQSYNYRLYRRIQNIINRVLIPSSEEIDDVIEFMTYLYPTEMEKKDNYASVSIDMLELTCEKELCKNYLLLLQNAIDNKEVSFIDNLIGSKYYLAFINPDIEENMIWNQFDLSDLDITSSVQYTVDCGSRIDKNLLNNYKDEYIRDICLTQIKGLLEIPNADYDNEIIAMNAYLRNILLRAAFLSMDDTKIADLNFEFHEVIDDLRLPFLQKSIDNIISAFKSVNKDKKKKKELKKSTS